MLKLNLTTKRLKIRRFCTDDIDQVSKFVPKIVKYYIIIYQINYKQFLKMTCMITYQIGMTMRHLFYFSCFLQSQVHNPV